MIFGKRKEKVELKPKLDQTKSREELWLEYDEEISRKIDAALLSDALEKMGVEEYNQEEVIKSYGRLVLELADRLSGYNTIISDDASGRIPSLVFYELIKEEREKRDRSSPNIYFVAGGRHISSAKKDSIFDFLKGKKEIAGKTLLITEHVQTGQSIKFLMETLESIGINFDAISISTEGEVKNRLNKELIFGGMRNEGVKAHYKREQQSGVFKSPNSPSPHPQKSKWTLNTVREAREGIKTFAGELSKLLV
jgi:hypothetical protein